MSMSAENEPVGLGSQSSELPTTNALELLRHRDGHNEVLRLVLGKAIGSRDVVFDSQVRCEFACVSRLLKITEVWARTVGVHLVDRDFQLGACLHLRDLAGSQRVLGILADVDVAR